MKHYMNLHNDPFEKIKNHSKTVEMRLNDEKRQKIKAGHKIIFTNNKTNELMIVKVKNTFKSKDFKDIYEKYDKVSLGYNENEIANYEDMFMYYTPLQVETKEALAIEIEYLEKKSYKLNKRIKDKERHRKLNEAPKLKTLEEIGNAVTHGVGALLGVLGMILLILKSTTPVQVVSGVIYCTSIILMMLNSCLYHSFKWGLTVKRIWRRFDYASIYLLIGGTFAPIQLVNIGGTLGLVYFIIMWSAIVTGITFVSIFGPGRLKWLHYGLYFIVGWSGLMVIPMWIKSNIELLIGILAGGIVYTLGMIPFVKKEIKSAHFIWHFFVLVGAIVHFVAIYLYIY